AGRRRPARRRTPARPGPRSRWDAWPYRSPAGTRVLSPGHLLVGAAAAVLWRGEHGPNRGATRRSRGDVAVVSYPGFTLLVFERLFEPIGRAIRGVTPGRATAGPCRGHPETGFSRVWSSGRGVRPSPPTPGRWADARQPGVVWGSSTPGWPTPERGASAPGSGPPAVPSSAARARLPSTHQERQHAYHSDRGRGPSPGGRGGSADGASSRAAPPDPGR